MPSSAARHYVALGFTQKFDGRLKGFKMPASALEAVLTHMASGMRCDADVIYVYIPISFSGFCPVSWTHRQANASSWCARFAILAGAT